VTLPESQEGSSLQGLSPSQLPGPGLFPSGGDGQANARAKRVLVVAPQPFYSDRGTPIAVRQLLEALSQLAYRIDVLTYPVGRSLNIPGVRYVRIANPLGIRSVPIGFSLRKLWLDLFLFLALRRMLKEHSYSCVHAVEDGALLAVIAARRHRVPVIYDMQSSMAEQMASMRLLRSRSARTLLEAWERWLARSADITVTSAGLADRVRASVPATRLREWRYPNPVREVDRGDVDRLRSKLAVDSGRPIVMYTGTFEAYQGLSILFEAMPTVLKEAPQTIFVLVGVDESRKEDSLRMLGSSLPSGAYRLLERQPRDLIPTYLALADIVVSPRIYGSNLPLKVLEYLAAGRAIVATSIPAHRTILTDDLAILTEPTATGLAAAITELLKDSAKVEQLRAAARAYAVSNLDWIGFVYSVGEMYREVTPDD
jgi:glycosyltransferase involved in cell wall biosynthesis